MPRTIAVLLVTAAALGSSACRETDVIPTEPIPRPQPVPVDALQVSIDGPSVIENSGIYQWKAEVGGTFEGLEYEWIVEGLDNGDQDFDTTGQILELAIDVWSLRELRIELRVRAAGDKENTSEVVVAVCPFSERIDECPRRVFQQNRQFPR